jgi:hypothetical protein
MKFALCVVLVLAGCAASAPPSYWYTEVLVLCSDGKFSRRCSLSDGRSMF